MKTGIVLASLLWLASSSAWAVEAGTGSDANIQSEATAVEETTWQDFLEALSEVFEAEDE